MKDNKTIDWTFYQAIEYFNSLKEIQCARHIIEHSIDIERVKQALVNEYGTDYGWEYTINVLPGQDADQLCQKLIEEVIGEEYYYGPRDVWDQIRIKYNYL